MTHPIEPHYVSGGRITVFESPQAYRVRRNGEPLPGSYLDQVERPLRNPFLNRALERLDQALQAKSPGHARALIQEAAGAIRNSEDG